MNDIVSAVITGVVQLDSQDDGSPGDVFRVLLIEDERFVVQRKVSDEHWETMGDDEIDLSTQVIVTAYKILWDEWTKLHKLD